MQPPRRAEVRKPTGTGPILLAVVVVAESGHRRSSMIACRACPKPPPQPRPPPHNTHTSHFSVARLRRRRSLPASPPRASSSPSASGPGLSHPPHPASARARGRRLPTGPAVDVKSWLFHAVRCSGGAPAAWRGGSVHWATGREGGCRPAYYGNKERRCLEDSTPGGP